MSSSDLPSRLAPAALGGGDGAVLLRLRVQPGAKRSGVVGIWQGVPRVAIASPPVDGAANAALIRLVATLLGLPASAIRLQSGQHGRSKTLRIVAPLDHVRRALDAAIEAAGVGAEANPETTA